MGRATKIMNSALRMAREQRDQHEALEALRAFGEAIATVARARLDVAALLSALAVPNTQSATRTFEPAPKPAPPQEPWPDSLTGEWSNRAARRKAKRRTKR
jgi:type II secretory pathway pseudopilin PulG